MNKTKTLGPCGTCTRRKKDKENKHNKYVSYVVSHIRICPVLWRTDSVVMEWGWNLKCHRIRAHGKDDI